jgi:hypothetical protein
MSGAQRVGAWPAAAGVVGPAPAGLTGADRPARSDHRARRAAPTPPTPTHRPPPPQLMPETLYLTCNLIDRFLSIRNVTRKRLQLVRGQGRRHEEGCCWGAAHPAAACAPPARSPAPSCRPAAQQSDRVLARRWA